MKKLAAILLLLFTMFSTSFLACKKNSFSSSNGDVNLIKEESLQKRANNSNQLSENVVLENFDNALSEVSTTTVADLMSPSFQSTSAYISLSNASIDLLQTAGALDSIKFHLDISDNSDPRLIMAAKLVNEMVSYPPDPLSPNKSVPAWADCLVKAGIGISINTIYSIFEGGSIALVGQAIKHMGYAWFAKTVGTVFAKVLTGVGGAIMLGQFAWCMASEYGLEQIPVEPGDESFSGPGGTLHPIQLSSYLLPITTQNNIAYKVYASHFTSGYSHQYIFTTYYFNQSDNKYYSDSNFNTLVPNGYYKHPRAIDKFYHIVNGVSIMLYQFEPAL